MEDTKICYTCKVEKNRASYNIDRKAKDGLRASCKACLKDKNNKWRDENRDRVHEKANSEYRKAWHNEYRRNRKDIRAKEARDYRAKKGDEYREARRKYYQENRGRLLEYRKQYIKKNPWFNRAASAKNRALILQRTPAWADLEEIKRIYRECPEGMVVDHIVPLRGKTVSGLHVHTNLQYLTREENGKKGNKYG